VQLSGMKEW